MLVTLLLLMAGTLTAVGQKIYKAELTPEMFKAWDSNLPGANEVAEPEPEPKDQGTFGCANELYKELDAGALIYGHGNVYYLWYADITGTKTMTVTGTPNMKIRLMLNRMEVGNGGGDEDGGSYVELIQDIGEDGKTVFDLSSYEYVHVNAIKVPWGAPGGVVKSIMLEGTVKPTTGILSLIENGDAEGDNLASFPVSYDGPNNGDTAPDSPEIVEGGVDGSKCFKVTSFPTPTETWHTQFYIKFDQPMQEGDEWRLVFWAKADADALVSTSAQGKPRDYHAGSGIDNFTVTTEWQRFERNGVVTADMANGGKGGGYLSLAIDLNNSSNGAVGPNTFYFDNIEFGYDLGVANPLSNIKTTYGGYAVKLDLANTTNIADLVAANDGKPVLFPVESAIVTWNDNATELATVEGHSDGNIYVFVDRVEGEKNFNKQTDATVKVAFNNPEGDLQVKFTQGKWEGQILPEISGFECEYDEALKTMMSSNYASATLESITPEAESINLTSATNEFTVTFSQSVDAESVKATLGDEPLQAVATDNDKVVILKRTAATELKGVQTLTISEVMTLFGYELEEPIEVKYSWGPTNTDATIQTFLTDDFLEKGGSWTVLSGKAEQPANSGSGCRIIVGDGGIFDYASTGFAEAIAYVGARDSELAYLKYGDNENFRLHLEPNTYHLSFDAARWDGGTGADADRQVTAEIYTLGEFDEEGNVISGGTPLIDPVTKSIKPMFKSSRDAEHFDIEFTVTEASDIVIKITTANLQGNAAAWNDACAIGNIKVQYVPEGVLGLENVLALEAALNTAKLTRDGKKTERYAGEAFNALDAVVNKYETAVVSAPSEFEKAIKELQDASDALTAHAKKCDEFDNKPKQAHNKLLELDSKFADDPVYTNLEATINKYATVTKETVEGEEGEEPQTVYTVTPIVITDDAQLDAAISEIQTAIDKTGMLTVGNSSNGTKGYAALHERLRLGVETAIALGMSEEDEVVKYVNSIKGDDDEAAAMLKKVITAKLYEQLKNENQTVADLNAGYSLDMSVFVKNPNIYVTKSSNNSQDPDMCPGWTIQNDGEGDISVEWSIGPANGGHVATDETPADEAISINKLPVTFKQEITDLPAGIYQFTAAMGERRSDSDMPIADYGEDLDACRADIFPQEYMFVVVGNDTIKTSVTTNGKSWGTFTENNTIYSENVTITDGKVTIGAKNDGAKSWFAFNDIKVTLVAPAAGFDYANAYNQALTGIDVTEAAPATVKAVGLYDLNGRQLPAAKKGVVIVKKVMSDGSVKTEKIVK